MKCEVCNETELEGEIEAVATSASSETLDEGVAIISLRVPTRRNYIICDSCNKAVCYNCCEHARSGYCNSCIAKYDLDDPLKGDGLIREL
jgi:hypothetical protein